MTCPHIEEIISFALAPERENNSEIATHIYGCRNCMHELKLTNKFVIGLCKITEDDVREVIDFLSAERNASTLWKKLATLLNTLSERIGNIQKNADDSDSISLQFPMPGLPGWGFAALAAAENGYKTRYYDGEILEIGFAAELPRHNPYYWFAKVSILPCVTLDSILIISVTDFQGESIERGMLTLLGLKLPVEDGIAKIGFAALRENLKNTTVEFRNQDGTSVAGNLVIC